MQLYDLELDLLTSNLLY